MSIKVFFNNSCNICRFEITHYKKIADSSLEWVDITNNNEALRLKNHDSYFIPIINLNTITIISYTYLF